MSSVDILVPDLPESVADATVATWHKKPGDSVKRDEVLVEIETDKVVLEVPASADGILDAVLEEEGTTVTSRQILGRLKEGNSAGKESSAKSEEKESTPAQRQQASLEEQNNDALSPAIRRLLAEHNLEASDIKGTGVGGRLTREDVEKHLAKGPAQSAAPAAAPAAASTPAPAPAGRTEKRVPMTRLRKRVAERLLEAKNSTAMLTTFNEVNMKPIMDLRKQYGDAFEKRHGIRLGFMSFYVKAVVEALKRYPEVNASIDGDDVVYHNYFDVSMAVSTPRGLVTPVLRDVDTLGMADIEKKIKELALKGRDGKLTVEDLTGGNFTITNGGVFGSLMSTPIINPPQSAILGMHAIKDRPMAVNGKVEILPMMYLALSYDHRLIDGRESVGYLVAIKELLEDPTRLLLDV
ncbi:MULTISPECIES: 2-oxoglutarate dehydrogenase complex dihydrolipoyllysine-residue succinyltransferase [Kosakonia]|jgi:2-oxoglutarate dehydrogenase E2 component (dihydrolipoamide succinyltransferase)|uniref:Dihydrolipoyllysine-residue succinyltransferase component of 2-oxoglutarate dehydrogenase complex n=1 Tax=Kosakonia cowanii JCM 10956 = DSM 18146 TaxID=1300165 RepID=A0A807LJQ4_9ENTR|nr:MULTISPECIES: 2-oxoglutarate dehydrogenase complex dihydrolipoyllysine-residue succinyltransferase [Kosakonia]MDP9769462.1 2-oxoglutarate dehydrogenase E2 component (dihydrolipoamide succinyltransferase) [Atlantibacter hermannii]APZ05785.1 dihydrolipoamide succinyltransferase [Kosakonia cowanii JCM 10956 = DSM 18146]MDY0889411.1 2-oxoglutarate dehydrogenase complex dihydrolipoyllysine-residue succinyltransferase [Kosakonia sp. CFBP8986]QAR47045.1 2-oxoglutarate dehydrogenase complex dihydrol